MKVTRYDPFVLLKSKQDILQGLTVLQVDVSVVKCGLLIVEILLPLASNKLALGISLISDTGGCRLGWVVP